MGRNVDLDVKRSSSFFVTLFPGSVHQRGGSRFETANETTVVLTTALVRSASVVVFLSRKTSPGFALRASRELVCRQHRKEG